LFCVLYFKRAFVSLLPGPWRPRRRKCAEGTMKIYCEEYGGRRKSLKRVLCEEGDIATKYGDGEVNVVWDLI
jgi:hypothetical protein